MWKWYRWGVGLLVPIAATVFGLTMSSTDIGRLLLIAIGAMLLALQAIPLYALIKRIGRKRSDSARRIVAAGNELQRAAGTLYGQLNNADYYGHRDSDVLDTYESVIRPVIERAYEKACGFGYSSKDIDNLLEVVLSVDDLRRLREALMQLGKDMGATSS